MGTRGWEWPRREGEGSGQEDVGIGAGWVHGKGREKKGKELELCRKGKEVSEGVKRKERIVANERESIRV